MSDEKAPRASDGQVSSKALHPNLQPKAHTLETSVMPPGPAAAAPPTALILSVVAILGIVIGAEGIEIPGLMLLSLAGLGLAVAVVGRRREMICQLGLLVIALVLGQWRYVATTPVNGPTGVAFYIGQDVTATGTIAAETEPLDHGQNVRVAVESVSTGGPVHPVSGEILVHVGSLAPLAYGDRLTLAGAVASPPDLPGASPGSYRAYLAAQGIYAVMDYPRLRRLGTGLGNPVLRFAIDLRLLVEAGIRHTLPGVEGTLLLGILLGTRTRALGALTSPFIATGMIHVVAISGLKVSLVVGMSYRLARKVIGLRHALWPAIAILFFYVLVTGATPAGMRAAIMWLLALTALRFGRRSDAITSLALAAALLALITPRIVWDLGFQLSVAGTAAIVLLEPGIERKLCRLPFVLRETAAVTLAAQAGTLPLLIAGFGQVSLVAPVANALLLPLLSPILILGFPVALLSALSPSLGILAGWLVYPFLALMIAVVQQIARLPGAAWPVAGLPPGMWSPALAALYYTMLGFIAWRPLRAPKHKTPVRKATISLVRRAMWLSAGSLALLLATVAWQLPSPVYTLTVLPLGRGQGILVTTPHGQTVLIDGGTAPSHLDAALGNHLPFWYSHLDLVVLTDVDGAHTTGLHNLLTRYTIGRTLDPGAVYPPANYAQWRAALRDSRVPEKKLRTGVHYSLDRQATLETLLPSDTSVGTGAPSVALRLVVGRFNVLLLNRAALDTYPMPLQGGGPRPTVLILPAGGADPAAYVSLVRWLRPLLVILPSASDARDNPAVDAVIKHVVRVIGGQVWQSMGSNELELTTDGVRYTMHVGG